MSYILRTALAAEGQGESADVFIALILPLCGCSYDKYKQLKAMRVRELLEFLVFPKSYSVLSFYSKGHYAVRVRLTAEDLSSGRLVQAFPALLQGREARREEGKRASCHPDAGYYETEHFYVTFSEEKVVFNTACIFKVELELGTRYRLYLDFELVNSTFTKSVNDGIAETARKISVVDRRRIYVNSPAAVNAFKRVLFDDSDYFSLSDVYLLSQPMGEKVRLHDYQLGSFWAMGVEERRAMHHRAFEQEMQLGMRRNCELMLNFQMTAEEFYEKMIAEKLLRYRKLCQTFQRFQYHMSTGERAQVDLLEWVRADEQRREGQLMQLYQTDSLSELFMLIYQESHLIVRNTKALWRQLVELLLTVNFNLMEQLAAVDIDSQQKTKALWLMTYSDIQLQERESRRQHFLKKRQEILNALNVYEDMDLYHPFLTIENYAPPQTSRSASGEVDSLVVFVHGYQGSSVDLQKARNFMNIYAPNCHGLLIKGIEDDIDEEIEKLGEMVAQEVRLHLINSLNEYKRINFIGYSLGGIVARQALQHLDRYRDRMNLFISLASPHAGIRDTENPLVKTGIWFLTNFEKNKNLKQLNCEPSPDSHLISMYTLSQCDAISWFKKFVAVSSREDDFVPYQSSRIEEGNLRDITRQICLNLKLRIRRLERVEVWFDVDHNVGTLDKITGRRAHIEFLQNRVFLDCFFSIYAPLL